MDYDYGDEPVRKLTDEGWNERAAWADHELGVCIRDLVGTVTSYAAKNPDDGGPLTDEEELLLEDMLYEIVTESAGISRLFKESRNRCHESGFNLEIGESTLGRLRRIQRKGEAA